MAQIGRPTALKVARAKAPRIYANGAECYLAVNATAEEIPLRDPPRVACIGRQQGSERQHEGEGREEKDSEGHVYEPIGAGVAKESRKSRTGEKPCHVDRSDDRRQDDHLRRNILFGVSSYQQKAGEEGGHGGVTLRIDERQKYAAGKRWPAMLACPLRQGR